MYVVFYFNWKNKFKCLFIGSVWKEEFKWPSEYTCQSREGIYSINTIGHSKKTNIAWFDFFLFQNCKIIPVPRP